MEYNEIKKLAVLMKETGLTALEYSDGSGKVKLERTAALTPPIVMPLQTAETAQSVEVTDAPGVFTVNSPMVGVFYRAPGADHDPFVSVGDTVSAGDVLCIIEAMKMMNEITAEKSGKISEICVENKAVVEYGQALFKIDTSSSR